MPGQFKTVVFFLCSEEISIASPVDILKAFVLLLDSILAILLPTSLESASATRNDLVLELLLASPFREGLT